MKRLVRVRGGRRACCARTRPPRRLGLANNQMVLFPASRLWLPDWVAARFLDQAWNWGAQVESMERALAEGIPVKGYLHWTLMDNFAALAPPVP
jgi:hypothetical protein